MKLKIGISSCPNDIFAFYALMNKKVQIEDIELDFVVEDVEKLNQLLMQDALDISKASFHAGLYLTDRYNVLPVGAALGKGVGPLLLSKDENFKLSESSQVLCPGEFTTATLLLKLIYPELKNIRHLIFSEIMPSLIRNEVDFGVVIHEGRFTYQDYGLHKVADLGSKWEEMTSQPLPLGGIFIAKTVSEPIARKITEGIYNSINYGFENKGEVEVAMSDYAQELDREALWKHVELYVNQETLHLSQVGESALEKLYLMAKVRGLINSTSQPFTIV